MNIILLGYRGCGKSSAGSRLAEKTWKRFVDIDERTRARFGGATVAEIWDEHGEWAFRTAEVEAPKAAVQESECVIALGGGTLLQPSARAAVEEAPETKKVYLHCRPAVLAERIAGDAQSAAGRPALTEGSAGGADPDEIAEVLAQREPVYREVADSVLDVTYLDLDGVVEYLIRSHV